MTLFSEHSGDSVVPDSLPFGSRVSGNLDPSLNWMGQLLLLSGCPEAPMTSSLPSCRKGEFFVNQKHIKVCFQVST
jgi:hypothetical protein